MRRWYPTMARVQRWRDRRDGFTMMELMTVIVIMFLLMGMAVGGYVGMMRGARLKGAVSHLHNLISVARQHAITQQTSTFVMFSQNGTNASTTVAEQVERCWRVSSFPTLQFEEPLPYADGVLAGGLVYNVENASAWEIAGNANTPSISDPERERGSITLGSQVVGSGSWHVGDRVGFSIHEVAHTPDNVVFGDGAPGSAPVTIIFRSDGSTPLSGGSYRIDMTEMYTTPRAVWRITVVGLTGKVETSMSTASGALRR